MPDVAKADAAMRPSAAFNKLIDLEVLMSVLDPPGSMVNNTRPATVNAVYERMETTLTAVRANLGESGKALALAEKIVYGHLDDAAQLPERGVTYLSSAPTAWRCRTRRRRWRRSSSSRPGCRRWRCRRRSTATT